MGLLLNDYLYLNKMCTSRNSEDDTASVMKDKKGSNFSWSQRVITQLKGVTAATCTRFHVPGSDFLCS